MHRIGIAGLGVMGLRMAAAMRAHSALEVVATYDPKLAAIGADLPAVPNLCDLITDPRVECLYIASPPATHLAYVRAAAETGKAIFCEKPLAVSHEEAHACIAAARSSKAPSAVNFPFATAPAAVRILEMAASGQLGTIERAELTLRFRRWPREWQSSATGWLASPEQGGFLREVGSHFLFLALRLFGPGAVEDVSVEFGDEGTEKSLKALIRFGSTLLRIDAAVEGYLDDFNRFELLGSKRRVAITDWYRLDLDGVVGKREPADTAQLDELCRMLEGREHRLATFDEAGSVVHLVESMLARRDGRFVSAQP